MWNVCRRGTCSLCCCPRFGQERILRIRISTEECPHRRTLQVDLRERLNTLEVVKDPSSTALKGMYDMDATHTRVLRATGSASTLLTPEGVRRMLEVGSVAAGSNEAKGWRFEIRAIHRQVGPGMDELA